MDSAATVLYVVIGLHVLVALVDAIFGIQREPCTPTNDDADLTQADYMLEPITNPATGLPMTGIVDTAGNACGSGTLFDDD
jgi:hypothetical protein